MFSWFFFQFLPFSRISPSWSGGHDQKTRTTTSAVHDPFFGFSWSSGLLSFLLLFLLSFRFRFLFLVHDAFIFCWSGPQYMQLVKVSKNIYKIIGLKPVFFWFSGRPGIWSFFRPSAADPVYIFLLITLFCSWSSSGIPLRFSADLFRIVPILLYFFRFSGWIFPYIRI